MSEPAFRLKRTLLGFWAVWFTLVFVLNLLDAGKAVGLLPASWTFASGNYRFVEATTARYDTPAWLNALLFLGVLCWEATAALLFWVVFLTFQSKTRKRLLYAAFTCGLMLWGAFLAADELFIAYAVAGTHWRLFIAQLVTLLAIELLPGVADVT